MNSGFYTAFNLVRAAFVFFLASLGQVQASENVTIGSGSVAGIYYDAAEGICDLLESNYPERRYNCVVRNTSGSVFNVNALDARLLSFGIVQADRNWQAWNGEGDWNASPLTKIRSVVSLHLEAVHLFARADAGIKSVTGLSGKRVNLGNIMSGQRGNAADLFKLHGLHVRKDVEGTSFQQGNALSAYLNGQLDAFFYTVGFPSSALTKVAQTVPSVLVPLDNADITAYVAGKPYYQMVDVPGGTYPGIDWDIRTFGTRATLMASAETPAHIVYDLVRVLFDNLDLLRRRQAAFQFLGPENMLDGLSAPLHPGAEKYYREQGWIN